MVEQLTVNQPVTGSSPVRGAKLHHQHFAGGFFGYTLQKEAIIAQISIMKTLTITTLLLAANAHAIAQDDSHSANWYADFDQAAIVAKEQGKDLLIDFTGSDW